jgi:hypothetical protein
MIFSSWIMHTETISLSFWNKTKHIFVNLSFSSKQICRLSYFSLRTSFSEVMLVMFSFNAFTKTISFCPFLPIPLNDFGKRQLNLQSHILATAPDLKLRFLMLTQTLLFPYLKSFKLSLLNWVRICSLIKSLPKLSLRNEFQTHLFRALTFVRLLPSDFYKNILKSRF